ncbi:Chloride intracellular channel protein 4 [Liparis tanakae]|uniref:Chloride intracellular channel protein 4 n=1 Tax=Liparis tanakae TaxID=230148 RepID=A0A4Z2EJX6_9TELE|nr:Chloride intracellular channel protein 4 [Liparis tanakae]
MSTCILTCPHVSSCVHTCPLVSSRVLLCPHVSSCVLTSACLSCPPVRYPRLAPTHPESNTAGIDVFAKFSAFLDGCQLSLADCNLLPKLHILKVVAQKYRGFQIPEEMEGVWRYLHCASRREEFTSTCPAEREIHFAYLDVAKPIK